MPAFRPAILCLVPLALLLASCGASDSTGVSNRGVLLEIKNGDQQTGTVGASLPAPVEVQVTDLLDHPVSGQVVNFIVVAGGGDIARTVYTNGNGVASVTWQLGTVAGSSQQVEARTLGGDGIRKSILITATAAADQPDTITAMSAIQLSAAAGTAVRTRPSVRLADHYGNLVTNHPVTFAVTTGGGSLQGAVATTDSLGIATVQRWTLGSAQGPNQVTATAAGLPPLSFNANATSPLASHIGLTMEPAPVGQSGVTLTQQPVLQIMNDSGDPIPQSGVPVTASLVNGTGLLIGSATVNTDTLGIATFSNLAIGGTVGLFSVQFVAPSLAPDTSATIALAAGPATTFGSNAGLNQSANAGATLPIAPNVRVSDDWGNGIPGVTVVFTVALGGGSVTGGTQVTGSDGTATLGSWTLGPLPGTNSLSATAGSSNLSGNPQTIEATGLGDFWSPRASMTTPRRFAGFAINAGLLYTVGGKDVNLAVTSVTEVYNPAANTWSPRASMTTARVGAAAGFIGGKLYVAGGNGANGLATLNTEVYSPNNTWAPFAALPGPRAFPAFGVLNGQLILAAGADNVGQLSSVVMYDPVTNAWTARDSLPVARNDAVGVVLGGKFYVIGGQAGNTVDGALYGYDPQSDSWTTLASMPTPRYHANAEVLNGRIYVVSGIVAGGNTTPVVEVYDPATNTWSTATDVTTERSAGAIGVVNGILYLAGGSSNNTVTGVLEAYVP
ncbi:MAG TPA: kelch repeat-containing protein [Gemmatimonadales bacterium]|nr:kelch repeat-containing protein [Gemmatimonadales bacterium]